MEWGVRTFALVDYHAASGNYRIGLSGSSEADWQPFVVFPKGVCCTPAGVK